MNNNVKCFISFALGAAIATVVTARTLQEKYAKIAEEDIKSLREFYEKKTNELADALQNSGEPEPKEEDSEMDEYVKIASTYDHKEDIKPEPIKYSHKKEKKELEEEMSRRIAEATGPRVITPEEFGENSDYDVVNLSYYEDGYLADDLTNELVDIEETVGFDALEHIGDYEPDIVHVVNDDVEIYYEITRDLNNWKDLEG